MNLMYTYKYTYMYKYFFKFIQVKEKKTRKFFDIIISRKYFFYRNK
jgi:hypothetical protein